MEVKRQARAIATQCRLLDAAREVFGREGFHGASVADVARAAGDSKGALYHHFAAKEDLLLALLDERISTRIEDLESRFADQPATAATTGAAADYAATLRTSEDGACNGRARGQRPDQRPRHRAPRRRRRRAGRVDRG